MKDYSNWFSEDDFWQKIKKFALKMGKEIIEKALWLYFVLQNPDVPVRIKAVIYSALGYFIMPFDIVPDVVPGAGYSDDLLILTAAVATASLYITEEVKRKAQEVMASWFGKN